MPGSAEISSWLWSPSGSFLATMRMATPSHVARPSDDGPALIDIDDGSEPVRPPTAFTILKWFGFESESYVIGAAAVDHTPASLVRCATDRSACAVIGELATGWESWRWATSPPSGDTATDESSATTAAAPNAPVVHGTTLDFDGQTYDVGHRVNLVSAGSTVLIGHWGKQITWRTIRNGQLVPIPYGKGHVPVLNPDGTRAVVSTNPTPQTSRITVYDTSTDARSTASTGICLPSAAPAARSSTCRWMGPAGSRGRRSPMVRLPTHTSPGRSAATRYRSRSHPGTTSRRTDRKRRSAGATMWLQRS